VENDPQASLKIDKMDTCSLKENEGQKEEHLAEEIKVAFSEKPEPKMKKSQYYVRFQSKPLYLFQK